MVWGQNSPKPKVAVNGRGRASRAGKRAKRCYKWRATEVRPVQWEPGILRKHWLGISRLLLWGEGSLYFFAEISTQRCTNSLINPGPTFAKSQIFRSKGSKVLTKPLASANKIMMRTQTPILDSNISPYSQTGRPMTKRNLGRTLSEPNPKPNIKSFRTHDPAQHLEVIPKAP